MKQPPLRWPALFFQQVEVRPKKQINKPGFIPNHMVAPAEKRFINKYYYDGERAKWYLVLDCRVSNGVLNTWTLREVDPATGKPIGYVRKTDHPLWANKFADRPFDVNNPESDREWFGNLYKEIDIDMMYATYVARRKITNSYEALVYLNLGGTRDS
jgi:hypothetical protein